MPNDTIKKLHDPRKAAALPVRQKPAPSASFSSGSAASAERCACGGSCPKCGGQALPPAVRASAEAKQRADFSRVRVHADAAEVTAPLSARAVTHGQDIYFHPGQFQPSTPEGKALIAHELAHTRQTTANDVATGAGVVSKPGDALERNADALANGATSQVTPAPAGAALRSPFDNETADERTRRLALLDSIDNARDRLLRLLTTRGLLDGVEEPVERNGVRGIIYGAHTAGTSDEQFVSYDDRDALIRRMIRSLMAMGRRYRRAPVPADFAAPVQQPEGEWVSTVEYPPDSHMSSSNYGGGTAEWADLQAAYERYRITQGQTGEAFEADWYYLNPSTPIRTGAARGARSLGRGINSGAYCVFPDIDGDPLNYYLLDGYTRVPRGATIVDLLHDDFGYYYMHNDRRIDVRSPWR